MTTPDQLRAELHALIQGVVLTSAREAQFVGGSSAGQSIIIAGEEGSYAGLARALYATYCGWSPPNAVASQSHSETFLSDIRAANPVPQRSVAGWSIVAIDPDAILVINARGDRRWVPPGELIIPPGGFVPGGPVRLAVPRDRLTGPTGHYMVLGGPIHSHLTGRQVRFYWNIPDSAAAPFITAVCKPLVKRRIPFEAKLPAHEQGFRRTDTAVLYLNVEHIEVARDILELAQEKLSPVLREGTPFFAERLGMGVAFAETPPENGSFGLHRCTLIAEGMVEAYQQGLRDSLELLEFLCGHMTRYGLDLSNTARNPGSVYPYRLPRGELR